MAAQGQGGGRADRGVTWGRFGSKLWWDGGGPKRLDEGMEIEGS